MPALQQPLGRQSCLLTARAACLLLGGHPAGFNRRPAVMLGAHSNLCRPLRLLKMDEQAHLPMPAAEICLPSKHKLSHPRSPCPCLLQGGARLAEGLCRALGISQAVLVGHSAGALTAMEVFKRCKAVLFEQMRETCCASTSVTWQRKARHALPQDDVLRSSSPMTGTH